MTREQLLEDLTDAIWSVDTTIPTDVAQLMAEEALRVIERPVDNTEVEYTGICNCGQSGYPENSPHSNHPHRKGCPQYAG